MLLSEIAPITLVETLEAKQTKLQSAKAALRELKSQAASFSQSGRASTYDNLIKRAQAAVASAEEDVRAYYAGQKAAEANRTADRSFELNRARETPEQKKERLGQAMRQGHAASKAAGTMQEKATLIQRIYDELSNNGRYQLRARDVVEKASRAIGVDERAIYRWLEVKPEFLKTARLLGIR